MEVKPLAGLTKTLRVFLAIDIVITVIAVFADFYDFYSYANLAPGINPNEVFLPSDAVNVIVVLVQVLFSIILGITFLWWIYRTNKNLRALDDREEMTFTPGWAVGWYFIPIANLFKPYQVMQEIWRVSHKNESGTSQALLRWWWVLWVISNIIGQVLWRMSNNIDGVNSYIALSATYIVSDGVGVILSVVALMLVTQIGLAYSKNIKKTAP